MIRFILCCLAISFSLAAPAQDAGSRKTKDSFEKEQVYTFTEQQPEFPGDLRSYLSEKISYPQSARDSNIEGRVVVRFIVDEKGAIHAPEILRSADPTLDEEALRVVRAMPLWKPGRQNGVPVKCYFNLPITFRLQ